MIYCHKVMASGLKIQLHEIRFAIEHYLWHSYMEMKCQSPEGLLLIRSFLVYTCMYVYIYIYIYIYILKYTQYID